MRTPPIVLGTVVLLLASGCSSAVTGEANSLPGGETTTVRKTASLPPLSGVAPSAKPGPGLAEFTPSAGNKDPSLKIQGIEVKEYAAGQQHIAAPQRVAYDQSPPFGGNHDGVWAACDGVVYAKAVRTEHMIHTLEHGAVWIAYNPDKVSPEAAANLSKKVFNNPYTVMSPYPGLDKAVSLQSWGHRLKVDDPDDPRIDQFIKSLRRNNYTFPEPGAACDSPGFNQNDPPPFDPSPPPAGSAPPSS